MFLKGNSPNLAILGIFPSAPRILFLFNIYFLLILERKKGRGEKEREKERERERERGINLFHLFMHSLVASCMCPDWGSNSQPWCIGMKF